MSSRLVASDGGFALIEVMVSAVVLLILAMSTALVFDHTHDTSSDNRARDVAATLAQNDQDAIRQLPLAALAVGYHPGPVDKVVGDHTYTVTSTADWTQDSGGLVTCATSGSGVAYLQTHTSVTWAGMGAIKPVTADAIVSPGVAALGASKGALTVLLTKADGTGTANIPVTVDGLTAVTDANGCAVIGNLDVGPQTLTYGVSSYVDKDSNTNISRQITIGSGTIAQVTGYYDRAGYIATSVTDDASSPSAVAWPRVSYDESERSTPSLFTLPTAPGNAPQVTAGVFPFASAYKAYVGSCTGNNPQLYLPTYAANSARVTAGNTTNLTLPMRTSTITVNASTGALVGNNIATVQLAPDVSSAGSVMTSGCGLSARVATMSGIAHIQVPYGFWKVCVDGKVGSGNSTWSHVTSIVGGTTTTDDPLKVTPVGSTGVNTPDLATTLKLTAGTSRNMQACS